MSKRLLAYSVFALAAGGLTSAAIAQGAPGSEIVGQSIQVTTNGVTNTIYFDAGGAARIMSPSGNVVNATWTTTGQQLCLNTGAATECWPYTQAFQAGQTISMTSRCGTSMWMANAVNQPPQSAGERG